MVTYGAAWIDTNTWTKTDPYTGRVGNLLGSSVGGCTVVSLGLINAYWSAVWKLLTVTALVRSLQFEK